jgi:hypothetical protein
MPERKYRFTALLLAYPICACGLQDAPVAPTAAEKAVLERALSDTVALNGTCLTAKIVPETEKGEVWPSALSLGDGKLSYAGDPRYDQAALAWGKAKPLHANSLEMPDQAVRQGFRVLDDAHADASCREIRTLHTPRFNGDIAFVTTYVRWKSASQSRSDVQIFRFHQNHWERFGSGSTNGRPVI